MCVARSGGLAARPGKHYRHQVQEYEDRPQRVQAGGDRTQSSPEPERRKDRGERDQPPLDQEHALSRLETERVDRVLDVPEGEEQHEEQGGQEGGCVRVPKKEANEREDGARARQRDSERRDDGADGNLVVEVRRPEEEDGEGCEEERMYEGRAPHSRTRIRYRRRAEASMESHRSISNCSTKA